MKILQIDAYHHILGGAEKVMFNTAELLKEHGHEVIFFSLKWNENFESEYSSYKADTAGFVFYGTYSAFRSQVPAQVQD